MLHVVHSESVLFAVCIMREVCMNDAHVWTRWFSYWQVDGHAGSQVHGLFLIAYKNAAVEKLSPQGTNYCWLVR